MRSLKRIILFTLGLLAGVAVAVFIADNGQPVTLAFYTKQTLELPLSLIVLFAFVLGALLMFLFHFGGIWESFLDRRRLVQRVEELEEELVMLRNLPLAEAAIDLERPRTRPASGDGPALEPEVLPPAREGELYVGISDGGKG